MRQPGKADALKPTRIIVPILIGLSVAAYLFYTQFDRDEFAQIEFPSTAWFWIFGSFLLLCIRHLAYSYRLKILSDGAFSWRKCIELIFIWEFSSAVSPTSVGGSAVAFFVLSREKLPVAKTATIVIFTVILDSLFFLLLVPILYLLIGESMIRPALEVQGKWAWHQLFWFAYGFMFVYASLFYYGLFMNPAGFKRILYALASVKILQRFKDKLQQMGDDMILAAHDLRARTFAYKLKAFAGTAVAWTCRFLLLNLLIIAFTPNIALGMAEQGQLFARLVAMFLIIAFSPTPGGAGFVELLFTGFVIDIVESSSRSIVIATVWRVMSYYLYLIIGAIVISNWLRTLGIRKK